MNKQLDALLCDKNRKNIVKGLLFSVVLMLIVCVLVPGGCGEGICGRPCCIPRCDIVNPTLHIFFKIYKSAENLHSHGA